MASPSGETVKAGGRKPSRIRKGGDQGALIDIKSAEQKDIEAAALAYVEVRDARIKLTTEEVELKSKLAAVMKKHNREIYSFDAMTVTLDVETKEVVKVKTSKSGDDE